LRIQALCYQTHLGISLVGGDCSLGREFFIQTHYDIVIIGGGPAGSSAGIALAHAGMNTAIIEKKTFPREVLCGEFLSGEVVSAIKEFGLYDDFLSLYPNKVTQFRFIPENGVEATHALGFEAYALKRSRLDQLLLNAVKGSGAVVFQPAEVISIQPNENSYKIRCKTSGDDLFLTAHTVIAAYGKQSILDKSLNRVFASYRSGYNGVKYHINNILLNETSGNEIQLYTADGIYCGINRVSENETTLCFLSDRNVNQQDPKNALNALLQRNRKFRSLFACDPLTELRNLPVFGTGNIYFGQRSTVENGIFMIGDAASVIAPLAGDGIGMAMESGKLIASILMEAKTSKFDQHTIEEFYTTAWKHLFSKRLSTALHLQQVAMNSFGGNIGGQLLKFFPQLAGTLIKRTRNVKSII
jgi:flavin-dependent dehydrogenase